MGRSVVLLVTTLGLAQGVAAEEMAPPRSRALGSVPEDPVPPYVRPPNEARPEWLTLGVDFRARFESRSGALPGGLEATDVDFGVTRARAFVGIAPERTPFTFSIEVLDARQFGNDLRATTSTVNELDVLQLGAKVDLERATGVPLEVEAGRLSFDSVDRRLIARNRFRNTLNAFEGARVRFGSRDAGRNVELLALWPTLRRTETWDRRDGHQRLLGATAFFFRRPALVVEPYYLHYDRKGPSPASLHTTGVHAFGELGARLDHDVHVALQLGRLEEERHRALALHLELGRSFEHAWAPRVAAWLDYASGDAAPDDGKSGRFDPLFGAPHPKYGFTDLFNWQNMLAPTVSLAVRPHPKARLTVTHRFHWLASAKDAWVRGGLLDPEARSGSFLGQELDVELRWPIVSFMELNVQYGELFAGSFVDSTGGTGARGVYIAVTVGTP